MKARVLLLSLCMLSVLNGFSFGYTGGSVFAPVKGKGILKNAFLKGQTAVHAGIGIFSLQYPSHDEYLFYGDITSEYQIFPINLRIEYGLTNAIGIGGFINTFKARTEIDDRTNSKNSNGFDYKSYTVGVCGSYHAYMGKNTLWLDPYVQGMLGAHILSSQEFGDNNYFEPQKGGFAFDFGIGANLYMFQPLGIYIEAGYGVNILNAGVTLRF